VKRRRRRMRVVKVLSEAKTPVPQKSGKFLSVGPKTS
jgi:hypothetical protein